MSITHDRDERKRAPIARGVLDYFPDAMFAVANLSLVATEQHHPGQPMHWEKDKSTDHADCIVRHLIERGKVDTDGIRHSAKVAWRALALLQTEIEQEAPSQPTKSMIEYLQEKIGVMRDPVPRPAVYPPRDSAGDDQC